MVEPPALRVPSVLLVLVDVMVRRVTPALSDQWVLVAPSAQLDLPDLVELLDPPVPPAPVVMKVTPDPWDPLVLLVHRAPVVSSVSLDLWDPL